jgi:protocatechuate 3,4-dioxygenase beta subunit
MALSAIAVLCGGALSVRAQTRLTPRQVQRPFYPGEHRVATDADLTRVAEHAEPALGQHVLVQGQVRSSNGEFLPEAVVDVWQADHQGRYRHPRDTNPVPLDPHFQGSGRLVTGPAGEYRFRTVLPGPYPQASPGGAGWRCRHIHFRVSHHSTRRLTTQMYFAGDPLLAGDAQFARVPAADRNALVAVQSIDTATGLSCYHFDIVLAPAGA